jgi:osmotically-inducible protein OsmY
MRILTLLAVAAIAGGIYHYRQRRGLGRTPAERPASPDELLAESVRSAIAGAASKPVSVTAVNGIVTLRGTVPTRAERDLTLAAALAVPGITQVTNLLDTEEPIGEIGMMQSGIATGI